MSKSNVFENDILKLIFNGIPIAGLAKNDTSSPVTDLTMALHLLDPGEAGDQSTNEISYTGYSRVRVSRQGGDGWIVNGNNVSPAVNITFGKMTGGVGGIATFASVGTGVGNKMLYRGAITPTLNVVVGKIPRLTPVSVITEE
jgi:hypothetical protein